MKKLNITSQKLTNRFLKKFFSSKENYCRTCRAHGMRKFESYERKLTEIINGRTADVTLKTIRLICSTCRRTHVFLISTIIPYSRYSLSVKIYALWEYYTCVLSHHSMTVEKVCAKYGISVPTLYRWKKQYLRDKSIWLELMNDISTSPSEFLCWILKIMSVGDLDRRFTRITAGHRSFMENHKTADNQRYP